MDEFSKAIGQIFDSFVRPVVRYKKVGREYEPLRAEGSGFTFGEGTFITCWHRVSELFGEDEVFGLPIDMGNENVDGMTILEDVSKDENGSDLALAKCSIRGGGGGFKLATEAAGWGENVVALGYPLPTNTGNVVSDGRLIYFRPRVLRGYVASIITDDMHHMNASTIYELDMPAPMWSSGSPLFRLEPFEVVGVVHGEGETTSGTYEPLKYSIAHHRDVLANACS